MCRGVPRLEPFTTSAPHSVSRSSPVLHTGRLTGEFPADGHSRPLYAETRKHNTVQSLRCRRARAVHPGHTPLPCSRLRPAPQGVCRVSVMVDGYARMLPIVGLPAGPLQHLCPCVPPAEAGLWRGTRVPRGELAPVLTGKARGLAVASAPGSGPRLGHLLGMGCCWRSWLKLHVRGQ